MQLKMYDLCGADKDRRFSPFCWRIKMALAHKGLETEFIPWRFTEKEALAPTGQGLVPVIIDGDTWVNDSWKIALYLDEQYPDKPLMKSAQVKALTSFTKAWVETQITGLILKLVITEIPPYLEEEDSAYFVKSRTEKFGQSLEEFAGDDAANLKKLHTALLPARLTFKKQAFLCGDQPSFADYILFGPFQWARSVSTKELLDKDDPIYAWRERMLDLYDGLARKAPTA